MARYDLDESGTLNTNEEFDSLTRNLIFKLKERQPEPMITDDELRRRTYEEVGEITDGNAWTPEAYAKWFFNAFPRRGKSEATKQDVIMAAV